MPLLTTTVQVWTSYWGELCSDMSGNSVLYGFENESRARCQHTQVSLPNEGACFGFVAKGSVKLQDERVLWHLNAGQWFSLPGGGLLQFSTQARVLVVQCLAYQGIYAMGGPLEAQGRLRYIDGCSDSLLCPPPLLGDPCLNHLHFPSCISQTPHTHPSLRTGMIAGGQGICKSNDTLINLVAGSIFYIPKDVEHCFITNNTSLDVIAYHPDSDWGPTHEQHPMVNRTWVAGQKIDNQDPRHLTTEIIKGR